VLKELSQEILDCISSVLWLSDWLSSDSLPSPRIKRIACFSRLTVPLFVPPMLNGQLCERASKIVERVSMSVLVCVVIRNDGRNIGEAQAALDSNPSLALICFARNCHVKIRRTRTHIRIHQ
jgi:hypothetical protein